MFCGELELRIKFLLAEEKSFEVSLDKIIL